MLLIQPDFTLLTFKGGFPLSCQRNVLPNLVALGDSQAKLRQISKSFLENDFAVDGLSKASICSQHARWLELPTSRNSSSLKQTAYPMHSAKYAKLTYNITYPKE